MGGSRSSFFFRLLIFVSVTFSSSFVLVPPPSPPPPSRAEISIQTQRKSTGTIQPAHRQCTNVQSRCLPP